MIVIISLEGKKSNTEFNFFKGLNYHCNNSKIKIFAFEKARDSIKREKEIIGLIEYKISEIVQLLEEYFLEKNQKNKLFFIADGDNDKDFSSIERTKNIIANCIENKYNDIIEIVNKKVLSKKEFAFENLYKEIHPENWFSTKSKKFENVHIFDNFANSVEWFNKDKLNFQKIIDDMKKTNHPHLEIIEAIFLEEK